MNMPLTHDFKETIRTRAQKDKAFRDALLREGIEAFVSGDVEAGKAVMRDYINATIGFGALSKATKMPSKSLMRQFSPSGNPQARNLFAVLGYLQKQAGLSFELRPAKH
ncbi:hypothetical protein DYY67_2344 [Candidatus Nitrosotalea sp. TS]|nr:hypothetical protein [Candidatus Nitrosotalea sp. TS]